MSGIDLYTPLLNAYKHGKLNEHGEGEALPEPRAAVAATEYRGYAVATSKWKIIYMPEQNEGRLFDREVSFEGCSTGL